MAYMGFMDSIARIAIKTILGRTTRLGDIFWVNVKIVVGKHESRANGKGDN